MTDETPKVGPFRRAIQKIRVIENKIIKSKPLFLSLLVLANLSSGAFFGYNVGITGVAKDSLINDNPSLLNNSTEGALIQAFFGASFFAGNIFGPIATPILIAYVGFKVTLLLSAVIGLVGQIIELFAPHYYVLCVGRFIVGAAAGVTIVVGSEYSGSLAKIYLPAFKGFVGTMFLVGFSTNLLLANAAIFFQKVIFSWRWIISLAIIPNIFLLFISIIMPESPVWVSGKIDNNALTVPQQLRKLFFNSKNIGRMFLCFILIISYLFGGVITMKNYLSFTLEQSGIRDFNARAAASIGVTAWNFITAIGTAFFVNIYGRKTLLGFGYCVMFLTNMAMALVIYFVEPPRSGYIAIGLVCVFLIGNNGGINSLIFFIFNELFDADITVVSSALMFTLFQLMEFVIGFIYLPLQEILTQPGILLLFACNTCICGIILMLYLPETKIPIVLKGKKKKNEDEGKKEEKEKEEEEMKDKVEVEVEGRKRNTSKTQSFNETGSTRKRGVSKAPTLVSIPSMETQEKETT